MSLDSLLSIMYEKSVQRRLSDTVLCNGSILNFGPGLWSIFALPNPIIQNVLFTILFSDPACCSLSVPGVIPRQCASGVGWVSVCVPLLVCSAFDIDVIIKCSIRYTTWMQYVALTITKYTDACCDKCMKC